MIKVVLVSDHATFNVAVVAVPRTSEVVVTFDNNVETRWYVERIQHVAHVGGANNATFEVYVRAIK